MKTVEIVQQDMKREKGGALIVNFEFVARDEQGTVVKQGGSSFAVSQEEAIPGQIKSEVKRKLGYSGFTVKPYEPKRGPGRPLGSRNVA